MKIKLNTKLLGFKSGRELNIRDINGVPIDDFWRARLRDAKRDNCITVITEKVKSKAKSKTDKKKSLGIDE